jgi:hypothetical protein
LLLVTCKDSTVASLKIPCSIQECLRDEFLLTLIFTNIVLIYLRDTIIKVLISFMNFLKLNTINLIQNNIIIQFMKVLHHILEEFSTTLKAK